MIKSRAILSTAALITAGFFAALMLYFAAFSGQLDGHGDLPRLGTDLSSLMGSPPPYAGRILVVSDYCEISRRRANAYLRELSANSTDRLLVVEDSLLPFFRPLLDAEEVERRVLYVSDTYARNILGIHVVPSYVELNETGIVKEVGNLEAGRLRDVLHPRRVARSWLELLRRL